MASIWIRGLGALGGVGGFGTSLFTTLWLLWACGDPQLDCYLLHFGHLGHFETLNLTAIYYTLATWGAKELPKWSKEVPKGSKSSRSGPKGSLRHLNWCLLMFCKDSSLLNLISLNSGPLNFGRLNSSSLNSIPLRSSSLYSIPLSSSPLNSRPLNSSYSRG